MWHEGACYLYFWTNLEWFMLASRVIVGQGSLRVGIYHVSKVYFKVTLLTSTLRPSGYEWFFIDYLLRVGVWYLICMYMSLFRLCSYMYGVWKLMKCDDKYFTGACMRFYIVLFASHAHYFFVWHKYAWLKPMQCNDKSFTGAHKRLYFVYMCVADMRV